MKLPDNLRNLYLHFHKTYGLKTWQGFNFREEVQYVNAYVVTNFLCFFFIFFLLVTAFGRTAKNF